VADNIPGLAGAQDELFGPVAGVFLPADVMDANFTSPTTAAS